MKKLDILVFGSDWHGHIASTHHLVKKLSQKHRVLWVNSLGMRTPQLNRQDMQRLVTKGIRLLKHSLPRKEKNDFWVIDPFYLPIQKSDLAQTINQYVLSQQLQMAMSWIGFRNPIVLTTFPNSIDILQHLKFEKSVYYCLDDFGKMPGVDGQVMQNMEQKLADFVDLVVVSADSLKENLQRTSTPIHILPHGVDLERFNSPGPTPSSLAKLAKPRIGFFGALDSWLNLELIAEVAKEKPEWQFPIVGPSRVDTSLFKGLKNVHLLGAVPFDDIPGCAHAFDIGLLPFHVNDFTKAINPLKLREYLAAGLPCVSTSLPEVCKYKPFVEIADTKKETILAIEKILNDPPSSEELRNIVAKDGWTARAQEFDAWIQELA